MKVLKICTLSIVCMSLIFPSFVKAHSETVANLTVAYAEDGLVITASLEKNHLAYALKKEAKCHPKDMLRICANQYLKKSLKVFINGQEVDITKLDQRLTKSSLKITYTVKFQGTIKRVDIQSNYMIQYNDHAKVEVISRLSSINKTYSLSARRKKIMILIG